MSGDPADFPGLADPPTVGAYVAGPPTADRQVVRWADQLRDHHELAAPVDPDREAYLSAFCYPPGPYCRRFVAAGYTPRGYGGPAACRMLVFDIDRPGDLGRALADARALARFLLGQYGPHLDDGLGCYFSGSKGFHVAVEFLPGFAPSPDLPGRCKRLALRLAGAAGVRIDTAVYDHQRLVRLPNSRHPRTGLYKRLLATDELFRLTADGILGLARHPAAVPVPSSGEFIPRLEDDWLDVGPPARTTARPAGEHPAVPKFVRDFIGWADIQDPGRALTLFRCAAALAEAGTPDPVVAGLLEEPAVKSGLDAAEVRRQIARGVEHGRRAGGCG
ncbi:MAG: hypothetical protein K2X82_17650 [Gemmataceae bacterium]|nr:hypothetical protein [Gemmataceae bacterium]